MKNKIWIRSILIASLPLILLGGFYFFYDGTQKHNGNFEGRKVYDRLIKTKADVLNVQEPIELVFSDIYADGGTIDFVFRDTAKKTFHAVLPTQDCYIEVSPSVFKSTKVMQYELNGRLLTNFGKEEQALCGLLMRWAKQYPEFSILMETDEKKIHRWFFTVYASKGEEYYKGRGLIFTYVLMKRQINQAHNN